MVMGSDDPENHLSREQSEPLFRVLGPLEVGRGGDAVRISPGRQEVVLGALLLDANHVVSTDHLIDAVWGEDPPDTARSQIQICVSRVRRSLAQAGMTRSLVTRGPGYLMKLDEDEVDLHRFKRQVREARALLDQRAAAAAAQLLRSAVSLWRGSCLAGVSSEVLQLKAQRFDEEYLTAMELCFDLEIELGRHLTLVGEISRLLVRHPLREHLRGQLMRSLYLSGRQPEALEVYREGRALLAEELGLEPGAKLRALESAILSGELDGPDTAEGTRPVPGDEPQAVPRQLLADSADLVVDDELIGSIEAALTGPDNQPGGVAVLFGKPGVGKTAVANHVAHRLSAAFPDGQLYCDLRGTSGDPVAPEEVLGRFLRALGIPGQLLPAGLDERAEMYRTLMAHRRVLLLLDDAASEPQVRPLLPGSGRWVALVTSRMRLTALPGAWFTEINLLRREQALQMLGRILGTERVTRETEAADALIRTVGALPLALRIIAARLAARPHWTLASMVQRLADERHRLDELTHGELTVRASIGLTYDGLPEDERRLLGLLSLADGPTLPGWLAGVFLDDPGLRPLDLMERLADMHMLDVVGVERGGEIRYRFHDIIRVFAREHFVSAHTRAQCDAAVARLGEGWLAVAEYAHRRIYGGEYTVVHGSAPRWRPPLHYLAGLHEEPLDWLDGERLNLCSIVAQTADAQLDELCWDLSVTLVTLFEARGYLDLWEQTHTRALEVVRAAGNRRGTAALLGSMGTLYLNRREPVRAAEALHAALQLFEELDEPRGRALCRRDLALLLRQRGDDNAALELYDLALADFLKVDDIVGRGIVLTQSAYSLMRRGATATAHTNLVEALEIFRTVGFVSGEAHALRRVGQMLVEQGEYRQAEQALMQVLTMVARDRDVIGETYLLHDLADLNSRNGRHHQAIVHLRRALALHEQVLDLGGSVSIRLELAQLLVRLGDPQAARRVMADAAPTARDRTVDRAAGEAPRLLGSQPM